MEASIDALRTEYDVVICGAGIAGLTLARQIAKEVPEVSLLLIEGVGDKSNTGAIQVGESTIEISANYLANVVDLREYLEASHFHKRGLRFFFRDGSVPLHERPEFGTSAASPLNSYQLDRALLEADVKKLNSAMGIQMLAESKVENIDLSGDGGWHTITVLQKSTGQRHTLKSRWVIDAMGRRRFLQKKLGLAQPKNPLHSASWFRLPGRIDICDMVPRSQTSWHARVPDNNRYYSTNHLMANGRWVWLIPLASGNTSIGIVAREDFFPFTEYNTYERALKWLQKHEPFLWEKIQALQPVDFQCLRHYTYSAQQIFSAQRWACTGDAAVFSDPFLSPGIDQAGFANTLITDLIKRDHMHTCSAHLVDRYNETFLAFHNSTVWITQPAYAFYGEGLVMGTKLLWDFARGFSLNAAARFNNIYLDEQKVNTLQPMLSRLFLLTLRMEKLFKVWATRTSRKYASPFVDYLAAPGIQELYLRNFQTGKTIEDLVADHQKTLNYIEELAQIFFLLALADTMPEMFTQLPSPLWLNTWGIGLEPARWKADKLFVPTSRPRSLKIIQFASIFGVTNLPSLLVDSKVKIS